MKKFIKTLAIMLMFTLLAFPTHANAATNKVTPTSKSLYCDQSVTLKVKGATNNKIKVSGKWYTIKWRYSGDTDLKIKNGKCSFDYGELIENDKLKVTAYYVKSGKKVTLGTCTITVKGHSPKYIHKYKSGKYDYMACARCSTCYKRLGKHTHQLTTVKTVTEVNKWERCGVHKKCTVDNCNYYTVENAKDYKFTEQEVYNELVQIVDYAKEYRIETDDWQDKDKTSYDFKKWLVAKGYYPESILNSPAYADSKSTAYDKYYWGIRSRNCVGVADIVTACLQGYQRYKCIATDTYKQDSKFDYTTLKPGDALVGNKTRDENSHTEMFVCWVYYEPFSDDGGVIPVTEDVNDYIAKYGKECIWARTIFHSRNYLDYNYMPFNDVQGSLYTDPDTGESVWGACNFTGEVWRLANY